MSVGPLTPPHPPSSLSPPLLLLPSSPPSPYLVGTVGRTARRARAGREETLPLRTRLPASSPCLPTSLPPPSPLACHRARRDTLSSGSNPSYSNDMGGCYGGGEEGSCCLTPAMPSPPKTTMATDLRRTRTSPSRPPPPSQHRSAGKGGGLIGLGWRKHSDAGGDGGGWAEQVARRSRGTAARKLITLSSYSTPTHPLRRSQRRGRAPGRGRAERPAGRWVVLTDQSTSSALNAWLQQAAPATQARGEEVEDDDNNADDAKSGFVDPRASLTGVLASSCPAHWPPHRLQVIGGVADR